MYLILFIYKTTAATPFR